MDFPASHADRHTYAPSATLSTSAPAAAATVRRDDQRRRVAGAAPVVTPRSSALANCAAVA